MDMQPPKPAIYRIIYIYDREKLSRQDMLYLNPALVWDQRDKTEKNTDF